ncbi:MAG: methyltransferase domain-containing protein [Albidovulum sp.]|jgi:2-polyprenyl-3-methyl-5-hydroxy-6-metoxy-1,4-benzoquinol methylase
MAELAPQVREEYHSLERKEVLALVPDGLNSVLDIGGGVGGSAAYLKSIGKATKATVVDLVGDNCLPAIDAAYGGNLEDPALLQKIEAEQGKFDIVLCLDVLEHLSDPWAVIKQLDGMLNPGGVIIASIPNVRNYKLVVPLVFKGQFKLTDRGIMDRTHLRWFVRDTASGLMTCSGLKLEYIQGFFEGRKKKLFNKLTFGLFSEFLVIQFYIRVRKPA